MQEQQLENEKADLTRQIKKQEEEKKRSDEVDNRAQKRQKTFDDTASTANVTVKSYN
jgi:hypothetical protein